MPLIPLVVPLQSLDINIALSKVGHVAYGCFFVDRELLCFCAFVVSFLNPTDELLRHIKVTHLKMKWGSNPWTRDSAETKNVPQLLLTFQSNDVCVFVCVCSKVVAAHEKLFITDAYRTKTGPLLLYCLSFNSEVSMSDASKRHQERKLRWVGMNTAGLKGRQGSSGALNRNVLGKISPFLFIVLKTDGKKRSWLYSLLKPIGKKQADVLYFLESSHCFFFFRSIFLCGFLVNGMWMWTTLWMYSYTVKINNHASGSPAWRCRVNGHC